MLMTTITSIYGVRGGVSRRCFDRYVPCDADVCDKSKCLWLTPQQWGLLMGFSVDAHWSDAKSCDCGGCTSPAGKPRGNVGDIERGNAIVPAQALLVYRPIIRALVRRAAGQPAGTQPRGAPIGAPAVASAAGI